MSASATAFGAAGVRVPATSANLGPGYDALGLALTLRDEVTARTLASGLEIHVSGEGAAAIARDASHLVVQAMHATFAALEQPVPGLALECTNRIPHGRGLGSSAAAICAGVLLARQLAPGGVERLDHPATLDLCAGIEGHPDNVAACLLGGATIAWRDGAGPYRAVRVDPVPAIRPIAFVPDFESSTEHARRLLPATVPHADAAFNAARSALLVAALTGDPSVLLAATEDRLHQPYRAPAMPPAAELVAALRRAGVAAVVSGAGPTVLALIGRDEERALATALVPSGWRMLELEVDRAGATVRSLP